MPRVIIIGAGVGGLTAAALLARAGLEVTVLEAHIYPGGCAGTFYHRGFRFDAGATLAGGFYPGGPMDMLGEAAGITHWPARPADPAMIVYLPDGERVARWADHRRWTERHVAFGPQAEPFWRWQERTADALWSLALRRPAWPPQTFDEAARLAPVGVGWLGDLLRGGLSTYSHLPHLVADALRPAAVHLKGASPRLRLFVDAQLLISAQATSRYANALYAAAALDLPRRGVVHLKGGMGTISEALAAAVRAHGGQVHYRQRVSRIAMERGRPVAVETATGKSFPADLVVINLTPWDILPLLGDDVPHHLRKLSRHPKDGWGAYVLYVGLDGAAVPHDLPLHHQVVVREPLGEGNTVFLSLSPAWDIGRAPAGQRALTLSTHTQLGPWWELYDSHRPAYEARKAAYMERVLQAAELALPGLRQAATLILPGTPVTFRRFTGRALGWVGGFPQTSLWRSWSPRLAPGLWMVGDSVFPGQSTAAVALGGMRVAETILRGCGSELRGWSRLFAAT